jgi:hypothetical protein
MKWFNEYLAALEPFGSSRTSRARQLDFPKILRGDALQPEPEVVEPSSDSRIEMYPHPDAIEFVWRGRWSLTTLAWTTLVHLFWNGLVAVAIYQLVIRYASLPAFLFVCPFAGVGLICGIAWLLAITAPAWQLTWTFGERKITRHLSVSDEDAIVFEAGWAKRFDIQPPVRIELQRTLKQTNEFEVGWGRQSDVQTSDGNLDPIELQRAAKEARTRSWWLFLSHPDGDHTLRFRDQADKELLAIHGLTEGDARWLADTLLRAFPSWRSDEAA